MSLDSLTTVRVTHDRVTLISFASMSSWAWFIYGLGAVLVFLRDEQSSPAWLQGLHGTALAVGGVIGALCAPRLSNWLGRGTSMRIGVIGTAVGVALFLVPVSSAAWTLPAVVMTCFFGHVIVVCVNAFISIHQGPASPAALTQNAGLVALMGLLSPLAIGIAGATVLGWRFGMGMAIVALVATELARGTDLKGYGGAGTVATRKLAGGLPTLTFWAMAVCTAYVGAEFCMTLWGATLIRERSGLSAAAAAAGLGAFLGGVFVGRAAGANIATRVSAERLLRYSLLAGLAMFVLIWFATTPGLLIASMFAMGVGISLAWPLCMARMLRSAGGQADRAASISLAFTSAAIGLAPFALGALAQRMPVHHAFLIVPFLIAMSLALVLLKPVPEFNRVR